MGTFKNRLCDPLPVRSNPETDGTPGPEFFAVRAAEFTLKDSGVREEFATGARRDTREGKGRFDLISYHALRRLALVMERGASKYGDHNWEKGMPLSRFMDSALRHLNQYLAGARDEDHLAQAAFNVFAMIHFEEAARTNPKFLPLLDLTGSGDGEDLAAHEDNKPETTYP